MLLVEDSPLIAERLSEMVTSTAGLILAGVVDTEAAALSKVREGGIDLMLLDLHLRQGTGFGVLRAIAKFVKRPTVIVLTNYDLPDYRRGATELGAEYFLDKGMEIDRLPGVIDEILARAIHADRSGGTRRPEP